MADATSAGFLFLAGPLAGWLLGRWIAGLAGWGAAASWVGGALGLVAAFMNFFRLAGKMNR